MTDYTTYPEGFEQLAMDMPFDTDDKEKRIALLTGLLNSLR